jgi:hypothetical protein
MAHPGCNDSPDEHSRTSSADLDERRAGKLCRQRRQHSGKSVWAAGGNSNHHNFHW